MQGFIKAIAKTLSKVIPYKIIKEDRLGTQKKSLDVEVYLIEGRTPSLDELELLSIRLTLSKQYIKNTFICFFLPGMSIDAGCFATGHSTPNLEVKINKFILCLYPQYSGLITQ